MVRFDEDFRICNTVFFVLNVTQVNQKLGLHTDIAVDDS